MIPSQIGKLFLSSAAFWATVSSDHPYFIFSKN